MKISHASNCLGMGILLCLSSPCVNAQISFDFQFYSTSDGSLSGPIIGNGTFSFGIDHGDGTFEYDSLANPSSLFTFDGAIFTNSDINSDTTEVNIIISTEGDRRRVQFSDKGAGGGGSLGGSIDFQNDGGDSLSFEPSFYGGGLNFYSQNGNFGDYRGFAQVTPEPGSIALLVGLGATCAGAAFKRRIRK